MEMFALKSKNIYTSTVMYMKYNNFYSHQPQPTNLPSYSQGSTYNMHMKCILSFSLADIPESVSK